MTTDPMLLTPEQAAAVLQLGRTKVFALMKSGELKSIRVGRSRRIPRTALEAWVNDQLAAQSTHEMDESSRYT